MKTTILSRRMWPLLLPLIFLLISCIPENMKDEMKQNMEMMQRMLAHQQFKNAIGHVELHKLRTGDYPASLKQLQFLTMMDSSMFQFLEYHKLEEGYELNVNAEFPTLTGGEQAPVKLLYPLEFWKGLGCVKSNARPVD